MIIWLEGGLKLVSSRLEGASSCLKCEGCEVKPITVTRGKHTPDFSRNQPTISITNHLSSLSLASELEVPVHLEFRINKEQR